MKKNYLEKTKSSVSTVIIVAVLTLMLTACNNMTESNANGANLTSNNDKIKMNKNSKNFLNKRLNIHFALNNSAMPRIFVHVPHRTRFKKVYIVCCRFCCIESFFVISCSMEYRFCPTRTKAPVRRTPNETITGTVFSRDHAVYTRSRICVRRIVQADYR